MLSPESSTDRADPAVVTVTGLDAGDKMAGRDMSRSVRQSPRRCLG